MSELKLKDFTLEYSEMLDDKALILCTHVGTCKLDDGTELSLASTMSGSPVLMNDTNGKKFVLHWYDIARIAVELGLTREQDAVFQVGKRYRFVDGGQKILSEQDIRFDSNDGSFTCHHVSTEGDCFTDDCTFRGGRSRDREGWIVAAVDDLRSGVVTLVEDEANG